MSVVNKMLQDLDARRGQGARSEREIIADLHASVDDSELSRSVWRKVAQGFGVAFILALLVALSLPRSLFESHSSQPISHVIAPAVTIPTKPALATKQLAVTPAPAKLEVPVSQPKDNAQPADAAVVAVAPARTEEPQQPVSVTAKPLSLKERAENDYSLAIKAIHADDLVYAQEQLRAALRLQPHYEAARESLISLLLQQDKLTQASALLHQGLALNPESTKLAKLLARLETNQGSYAAALRTLEGAVPQLESDPQYFAFMAGLYRRMGQPLIAAKLYERLVRFSPTQGLWWLGLAVSLSDANQINAAVDAYKKAAVSTGLSPDLQAFVAEQIRQLAAGA